MDPPPPGAQPTQNQSHQSPSSDQMNTNNASNNETASQSNDGSFNVIQKLKETMQEEAKRFQPYPQGGSSAHDPSSGGGGGVINGSDKTGGSNETGGEPPGTGPDQSS